MARERALQRRDRAAPTRFKHCHLAQHSAGRSDPGEPGAASKVITARQHRCSRRNQPGPELQLGAFAQPRPIALGIEVDPNLDRPRTARLSRSKQQPHALFGWLLLAAQHPRFDRRDGRANDRLGTNQRGLAPDQRAAPGKGNCGHHKGPPQMRIASFGSQTRQRRQCQPKPDRHHPEPLPGVGADEPCSDPGGKGDHCPGALLNPRFGKESLGPRKPAGQVQRDAPMAMLQCSAVWRFTVQGYQRQGFSGHVR